MIEGSRRQNRRGTKRIPTMNQVNLGSEFGEKHRLLTRGIAPADHTDRDVPIKGPITGSARRQTVTLHPFLVGQAKPFGRRATGNNHALRFQPFAVDLETMKILTGLEFVDFGVPEACAKFLRLPVHVHNQLRAIDPVGKSREILD
jgi:hypothetical protein